MSTVLNALDTERNVNRAMRVIFCAVLVAWALMYSQANFLEFHKFVLEDLQALESLEIEKLSLNQVVKYSGKSAVYYQSHSALVFKYQLFYVGLGAMLFALWGRQKHQKINVDQRRST